MSKKTAEYFSKKLSPIIRAILKQMSDKKIYLTDSSLNDFLLNSEEFKNLFSSSEITDKSLLDMNKTDSLVKNSLNNLNNPDPINESNQDKLEEPILDVITKQLVKSERRLATLTEFVQSLFKKVLQTQDEMTDNLEDNIRFVEKDLGSDLNVIDKAGEIEQILKEEGIIFPGKPFNKFLEAFDSKITDKQDKLQNMTASYKKIEKELAEYKKEVNTLNVNINKYREETITDHLTGLHNRKYLDIKLDEEINRFSRHKQPFCILLLDLDDFKIINDSYGHVIGDQVLKHLAGIIKKHIRKTDFSFRYGGEEFLVLLLNTNIENAMKVAEQIRSKVASTNFTLKEKEFATTITIGVAQYIAGESLESLIERADKNLYKGKNNGKNKVIS